MKAIRNCGACPGKMEYENSGMFMCPKMIMKKGKVEEMRLDLSTIHPDCPLSDIPESPNTGIVGKLRKFICVRVEEAERNQTQFSDVVSTKFEDGARHLCKQVLEFLDDFDSSPDVPAPARAKKIEWREHRKRDTIIRGFLNDRYIVCIVKDSKKWVVCFDEIVWAVNSESTITNPFDSLELAQQAAQTALNNFVTGLIETEAHDESKTD